MAHLNSVFSSAKIGAVETTNRIFMAPLTRSRADDCGVPSNMAVTYYSQRATAGLIITEATQIHPMGKGYDKTPGIHSAEQVAAWKEVTRAVHEKNGKIFLQLWHVGRISHSSILPDNCAPLAPSAIKANAQTFANGQFVDTSMPEALSIEGIDEIKSQFKHAAKLAHEADFDGVEVHAANGYLLEQFIMDGTNQRDDEYGGSAEQRNKLVIDIVDIVSDVWGADRVGVRLSPTSTFNDMHDSDRLATYTSLYRALNQKGLAYLHVVEAFPGMPVTAESKRILAELRELWTGVFIANGGYTAKSAEEAIARGHATAVTFGRPFIANPDLPSRFKHDHPIADPDPNTMYGGDVEGYIDYPTYQEGAS